MDEKKVKTNSFKAWVLAARPKTLTAAAVPVMIAIALAFRDMGNTIKVVPAVLCMLFAFFMQIDANLVNDYFDWKRGNDDEATRLGPLRACSQGWVTPKAMLIAIMSVTILSGLTGLPLVWYGGWEMMLVGVACVVFCVLYTTTLSYIALGDLLVLIFFGLIPVALTYYLQTGTITKDIILLSVGTGLVIDLLLIVNNYRDMDNDLRDGKCTLIVLTGRPMGSLLYYALGILGFGFVLAVVGLKICILAVAPFLFFHITTYHKLRRLEGRDLNIVLGETARNIILFGILATIALLLSELC